MRHPVIKKEIANEPYRLYFFHHFGDKGGMKKFYQYGLRFKCISCGECCRLPGGEVEITPEEAHNIAQYLRLELSVFISRFCYETETGFRLIDNRQGYCIFLEEDGCGIYLARPLQCRTFPFWPENLKSASRWKELGAYCPGIDTGNFYSFNQIREISWRQKNRDREQRQQLISGMPQHSFPQK